MTVRFIGDPIGYRLVTPFSQPPQGDLGPQWSMAYIGYSDRQVWIDVSKAYRIEGDGA